MNTADIEHAHENKSLGEIAENENLTTVEKAALYRAAQGDSALLEGIRQDRAGLEEALRRGAEAVDPGEYTIPEGLAWQVAHDFLHAVPYTASSMVVNAPASILTGASAWGRSSAASSPVPSRDKGSGVKYTIS